MRFWMSIVAVGGKDKVYCCCLFRFCGGREIYKLQRSMLLHNIGEYTHLFIRLNKGSDFLLLLLAVELCVKMKAPAL